MASAHGLHLGCTAASPARLAAAAPARGDAVVLDDRRALARHLEAAMPPEPEPPSRR